ncbi:GAF and ANTAR domain-containing protein [Streptacidiphilus sp. PAMC 29251]
MPSVTPQPTPLPQDRLATAFVELADTLVDTFDIIDFLHTLADHTVALLDLDAAGVILADPQGQLIDAAASNEATRQLELSGIAWDESPCRDCFIAGTAVPDTALGVPGSGTRWPHFASAALDLGFTRVAALPLRLRTQTVGALNLFHHRPDPLTASQLRIGQALADTATIGILQQRTVADQTLLTTQLQHAMQSRLVIEQAKGALAAHRDIGVDAAFDLMRQHARAHQQLLTDLAGEVIEGIADTALLGKDPPPT